MKLGERGEGAAPTTKPVRSFFLYIFFLVIQFKAARLRALLPLILIIKRALSLTLISCVPSVYIYRDSLYIYIWTRAFFAKKYPSYTYVLPTPAPPPQTLAPFYLWKNNEEMNPLASHDWLTDLFLPANWNHQKCGFPLPFSHTKWCLWWNQLQQQQLVS